MSEKETVMAIKHDQTIMVKNKFGQKIRVECKDVKSKGRFVCVELINGGGSGDSLCGFLTMSALSSFYDLFKNCDQPMVYDHNFTGTELGALFDTV